MTGPETATGPGVVAAVLDRVRRDRRTQVGVVLAFLVGTVAAFLAFRSGLWVRVQRDLHLAAGEGVTFVAATPYDVVVTQLVLAVLWGVLLAGETLAYAARGVLVPDTGDAGGGRQWRRTGVVLVAVALFPVGATVGYEVLVPATVGALAGGETTWPVAGAAGLAVGVTVVAGLAAQVSVVACGRALAHRAERSQRGR